MSESTGSYVCTQCGYVYEPSSGDPLSNIAPGTAFSDLPPAWVCPLCYAGKHAFDPLD